MRRNLASRVEKLEHKTDHGFDRIIPVYSEKEAKACRVWWRKQNPGVPDSRLLIVITGVPRANREPWDSDSEA
jgi:hypothetical protein